MKMLLFSLFLSLGGKEKLAIEGGLPSPNAFSIPASLQNLPVL